MKAKYAVGIVLPVAVILVIVVLSSMDIGFSVSETTVAQVDYDLLFTKYGENKADVYVQTITISNDFFMPKKYEVPKMVACFVDWEGDKSNEYMSLKYTDGVETGVSAEVFYDYVYETRQYVDVDANSVKEVRVWIEPKYMYDNRYYEGYSEYDEIILAELENTEGRYMYDICSQLTLDEISSAHHIEIKNE